MDQLADTEPYFSFDLWMTRSFEHKNIENVQVGFIL